MGKVVFQACAVDFRKLWHNIGKARVKPQIVVANRVIELRVFWCCLAHLLQTILAGLELIYERRTLFPANAWMS